LSAPTFKQFQDLLHEHADRENILVVGHNPNISIFLGSLLVPTGSPTIPVIRLRKGSIARVTIGRGPAVLQGLLDPRVVRALYATSTKSSRRKTSRK
jgi:phosphohistidine phosphatase